MRPRTQDFTALVAGFDDPAHVVAYLVDNAVEYDAGLTENQLKKIALKHKQKQALLGAAGESCLKDPIGDPSKRDLSVKDLKRGVAQSTSPKDNFSVKAYLQSMPPVTCRLKHSLDPGQDTCRGTVYNGKCLQCGVDGVTGVYGYSTEVVISDDPFDDKNAMVLKICDAGGFALFGCKAPEFMALGQDARADKQIAVLQEYYKFTVMVLNADKQSAIAVCTGAQAIEPVTPAKASHDKGGSSADPATEPRRKRRAESSAE